MGMNMDSIFSYRIYQADSEICKGMIQNCNFSMQETYLRHISC